MNNSKSKQRLTIQNLGIQILTVQSSISFVICCFENYKFNLIFSNS